MYQVYSTHPAIAIASRIRNPSPALSSWLRMDLSWADDFSYCVGATARECAREADALASAYHASKMTEARMIEVMGADWWAGELARSLECPHNYRVVIDDGESCMACGRYIPGGVKDPD